MLPLLAPLILQIAATTGANCSKYAELPISEKLSVLGDTKVGLQVKLGDKFIVHVYEPDPKFPLTPGFREPIKEIDPACLTWHLEAPDTPSFISVTSDGSVQISQSATGNLHAVLAAVIKGEGGKTLREDVYLYLPEIQPLVGNWQETGEIDCKTGTILPLAHTNPIGELAMFASGWFTVTWSPFESYKDYWGHYQTTGSKLSIEVEGGNTIPSGIVSSGTFSRDGKVLTIKGLSFGPRYDGHAPSAKPHCGYVFGTNLR